MPATHDPQVKPLCVGVILGAHGIRGAVRVKSFTADPLAVGAYGAVTDEGGRRSFTLKAKGMVKGAVIAEVAGITDRNAAEALKGLHLHVDRAALPPAEEEEFYHADLIGLEAWLVSGDRLGTVNAVYDFGAGDALEIAAVEGGIVMVPFTKAAVPEIDIAGRRLTIDPPVGLLEKPEPPQSVEAQIAEAHVAEAGDDTGEVRP
ncbi:MAG TPA: ribosome maturation factor RimM [Stellaceae bacterium]|nr:ribosome maturation factor RimM [Stellaceae bacterium]